MNFDLNAVLLALPILLLSLTAHEWGHAWVALKQGDDTAYKQGRVTMNPAAHVDPVGTLLFPAIAIGTGAPLLGWAKPVPTNPRRYRNFVRGDILVSIAGVCMNALLALMFALLLWIIAVSTRAMESTPGMAQTAAQMFFYGVYGNIGLIVFNLLPIPPLDGSHVFYHLLPAQWGAEYRKLYPYGFLFLWALILTGVLRVLSPLIFTPTLLLIGPSINANEGLMAAVFAALG